MRVLIQFLRATSAHSPNAHSPKFSYEASVFVWCYSSNTFIKHNTRLYVRSAALPKAIAEALKTHGAASGQVFALRANAASEAVLIEANEAKALIAKRPHVLRKANANEVKSA